MFSYKARALIEDGDKGLLVVACMERIVRVCAGLIFFVYDEYCLRLGPPDIIRFARVLGLATAAASDSRVNVQKVLYMLDIID